jgi:hypothetical protein
MYEQEIVQNFTIRKLAFAASRSAPESLLFSNVGRIASKSGWNMECVVRPFVFFMILKTVCTGVHLHIQTHAWTNRGIFFFGFLNEISHFFLPLWLHTKYVVERSSNYDSEVQTCCTQNLGSRLGCIFTVIV